jgi:DNA (cytosine-5)-methyltransferase 1
MSETITALDLFAGTGWGVACKRLGIREMGVEIMPEAIATRDANGMATIYRDVWDGLEGKFHVPAYQLLIASPPCQTFSLAGKGSGRAALNEVLEAIELHAYKDPTQLREFGEKHDHRTALVLAPLAHVWRDRPEYVAFEQVPTVLPVWEACADVMCEWGYSVDVAVLNAEQYGVPQTRKRAILVGRLNGEAKLPTPTHSRYYSNKPEKLDSGVKKWVSIAEALGWTTEEAEGSTYTGNNKLAHQAVRTLDQPAPTVTAGHDSGNRGFIDCDGQFFKATVEQVSALQSYPTVLRSNYGTGGDASKRGERTIDQPAPTLTSKADRNKWDGQTALSQDEASALQTYEKPFEWVGPKTKTFLQIGNAVPPLLAQAVLTALTGITGRREAA